MSEDTLIERSGPDWSITIDLSRLPEYFLVIQRGKATSARTSAQIEILEANLPRLLRPDGRLCPLIVDKRQEGDVTMDGMKAGRLLSSWLGERQGYVVFVLNPARADSLRLRLFIGMARWLNLGPTIVSSMEEALTRVQSYHAERRQSYEGR